MMEFVSWDDDIPNIWKNNPNVPNHQPDISIYPYSCQTITHTISKVMLFNTSGKY
jgi:hypothetical protein